MWTGCASFGTRLALGGTAAEGFGLDPALVDRRFGRQCDSFGALARQVEHRGQARWRRGCWRSSSALKIARTTWAISRRNSRAWLRRLRAGELEYRRQVVGQLSRCKVQAGTLVGLRQVDHRGSAIATVAMHVLEQMQCRAAAAVEELDVLGFGAQSPGASELANQRVQLGEPAGVERGLGMQGVTQLRQPSARSSASG